LPVEGAWEKVIAQGAGQWGRLRRLIGKGGLHSLMAQAELMPKWALNAHLELRILRAAFRP